MFEPGTTVDLDGSAGGGGRLSQEIQRDQAAQSAGLCESGGVCGAELSIPSSGRASPSLHWEWTKKQRKPKLKPMLGLTPNVVQKVEPGHEQRIEHNQPDGFDTGRRNLRCVRKR